MTKSLLVEKVFKNDKFPPKNALQGITVSALKEPGKSGKEGVVIEKLSSDEEDDPGG